MAPTLPSCISSTFCSHRQASWFLLATLSPFFLPFLILCVPFLLLFLAPVSVFLFSLLLLYKVLSLRRKFKLGSHRSAEKGLLNQGYQPTQQISAADQRLASLEEDRGFKGLEGSNVQTAESQGDGVGLCILPSRVFEREEEKLGHSEEELTSKDGITEEKQEKMDIAEGPLVETGREGSSHGGSMEYEGPEVSTVQITELPASCKAGLEEDVQSPDRERNFVEGIKEDIGKEPLRNDRMEDSKQEGQERTDSIDFIDEQKHPPLYVDATSLCTSEENRPLITNEDEKVRPSSAPVEWQGQKSIERPESSQLHHLEEVWSELPAIQVPEPNVQTERTDFPEQIIEKPWAEELNEQCEIHTTTTPFTDLVTQEPIREEPELSSKTDSSVKILDNKGRLDKKEDIVYPTEPFEKETEEGEQSYSSTEGHGQWRRKAEEGYSPKATSSAVLPPHLSHGVIEYEDRIHLEQKIMADINTIKKIVGYQGESHACILQQISALYIFLGMEPYNWAAEVDYLERAQAEIELLKVVVGVK